MVHYKLTYFEARGRVEPLRMILAGAKVDYAEEKITQEDWPALKPTTVWGNLPMMEIEGIEYGQNTALTLYFAEKFGFLGNSAEDRLMINQVYEALLDVLLGAIKFIFMPISEEEKAPLKEKFRQTTFVSTLTRMESLIQNNGFFVGQSLTLAEIMLYHTCDTVYRVTQGAPILSLPRDKRSARFPKLGLAINQIEDHPDIGQYIRTHWNQHTPI